MQHLCNFYDKDNVAIQVWQYSYGQELLLKGKNIQAGLTVQWHYPGIDGVDSRFIADDGHGNLVALIPDDALKQEQAFKGYVFYFDEHIGDTRYTINVSVRVRPSIEEETSVDQVPAWQELLSHGQELIDNEEQRNIWEAYDDNKHYEVNNKVFYTGTMSSYVLHTDIPSAGILPTNTDYWQMVAGQGGKGDKGDKGDTGASITNIITHYAQGDDGVNIPSSGSFGSTVPVITQGKYLWTRFIIMLDNGISWIAYTNSYHSVDGIDGADGDNGNDGRGISSTEVKYAISEGGQTPPSTWSSTVPPSVIGQYLWTRTVFTYTDSTTTTQYSVSRFGADGSQGEKGEKGDTGEQGPKGDKGDKISHEWQGTVLKLENHDGTMDSGVDLQGPKGDTGEQGPKGDTGEQGPKGDTGDVNMEQYQAHDNRIRIAEQSIASILDSNPAGSAVLTSDTYAGITSLHANAADAPMKADLSGMTVTNLVYGKDILDGDSVFFPTINGDKYYESFTPSIITGDGGLKRVTNNGGTTVDINVIHLNSIGLESETDTAVLDAMFPNYIDGTVHAGATRFTSKDEDGNIVSVSYTPPDIVLRSLPNLVADTTERNADGTQKKVQRVTKVTLSSGINWNIANVNDIQAVYLTDSSKHNYSSALPNAYTWYNLGGHFMVTTSSGQAINTVSYVGPDQRTSANIGSVYGGGRLFGMIFAVGTFANMEAARVYMEANPIIVYYQLATPIETDLPAVPALISKSKGTVIAEPCVCDVDIYNTGITVSGKVFSSISKVSILNLVDGTEEDVTADCTLNVGKNGFTCSSASADDYIWYELLVDTSTVANSEKNYQYFDSTVVEIDSVTSKVYRITHAIASGIVTHVATELV